MVHPGRAEAVNLATRAAEWLSARSHQAVVTEEDPRLSRLPGVKVAPEADAVAGADLAVSLGGDGTMLRTVQLALEAGVPVMGANLGQLGYLSSVEPARLCEALEEYLAGRYSIEERLVLTVRQTRTERVLAALNEAVLEKTVPGHTVRLSLSLSGEHFITLAADGVIVSTPTGSTAYNLSARGPILSPSLRALLVTPVSPHMLFDRSLVLDPQAVVRLEVLRERPAVLVVDGVEVSVLEPGDAVECGSAPQPARFVTFEDQPAFHSIVKAKFNLSDR
ncbi:MAG TPA: NAD(+)/NADH kinase [Acidimicrobiales bacterium]|nr:NAD(+)/NADH kinase [Acidimicrobiales bacterium]